MKILLTTYEGFPKDNSIQSKKRSNDRRLNMNFNGNDAPLKVIRALMAKYGISKDEL